jgi:hypothetical protein
MRHPVSDGTPVNVTELSAEVHAMSDTTRATTTRLDVQSLDGTPLAVWVDDDGPAYRRGSGASGDVAPYAIEREIEDVAAVVEAVAACTGGPPTLLLTGSDTARSVAGRPLLSAG